MAPEAGDLVELIALYLVALMSVMKLFFLPCSVESIWNVMAHGDERVGSEGETGEWSG